jgi:hypothetical protein
MKTLQVWCISYQIDLFYARKLEYGTVPYRFIFSLVISYERNEHYSCMCTFHFCIFVVL